MSMPSERQGLSISEAASATQVPAITLRAWERRYDLIAPPRGEGGHRVYTDSDIDRIQRIKKWIDRGIPPGRIRPNWLEAESTSASSVEPLIDAAASCDVKALLRLSRPLVDSVSSDEQLVELATAISARTALMRAPLRELCNLAINALVAARKEQGLPGKLCLAIAPSHTYPLLSVLEYSRQRHGDVLTLPFYASQRAAVLMIGDNNADGLLIHRDFQAYIPDERSATTVLFARPEGACGDLLAAYNALITRLSHEYPS